MLNPWTLDERCQRRARDQSRGGEEMEADCAAPRQGHEQKNRAICKRKYKKKMKKHKTKSVGRVAVESVVLIARNCLFLLLSTQPSGPLWLHVATVAHWAGWGRAHCAAWTPHVRHCVRLYAFRRLMAAQSGCCIWIIGCNLLPPHSGTSWMLHQRIQGQHLPLVVVLSATQQMSWLCM